MKARRSPRLVTTLVELEDQDDMSTVWAVTVTANGRAKELGFGDKAFGPFKKKEDAKEKARSIDDAVAALLAANAGSKVGP